MQAARMRAARRFAPLLGLAALAALGPPAARAQGVTSFTAAPGEAPAGTQVFADSTGPAESGSLGLINTDGGTDTDAGRLEAFTAAGLIIELFEAGLLAGGDKQTPTIASPSADIGYVLAGGDDTTGGDTTGGHPVFSPAAAPEPSQAAGLGLGALGLAALSLKARRRKSVA